VSYSLKTPVPDMISEEPCSNLVANKSGVIVRRYVRSGEAVAKVGDTVSENELLVSGIVQSRKSGIKYYRSVGEIFAKIWYDEKEVVVKNYIEEVRTGNQKDRYKLKFGNFGIKLYFFSGNLYEKYDKITNETQVCLFDNLYLPIFIEKTSYFEKVPVEVSLTDEEAYEIGKERIEKRLLEKFSEGYELVEKSDSVLKNENSVTVFVNAVTIENIAKEVEVANG